MRSIFTLSFALLLCFSVFAQERIGLDVGVAEAPKCQKELRIMNPDESKEHALSKILNNKNPLEWVDLELYDGHGQMIYKLEHVGLETTINVGYCDVFDGAYSVKVSNEGGECSCQVVADEAYAVEHMHLMDTVVYSIDPIAYTVVDEDYPFAPKAQLPCHVGRAGDDMEYVGDSILAGDCSMVFEKVIYRKWLMRSTGDIMTETIRVASLPQDMKRHISFPTFEPMASYLEDETMKLTSDFLRCQWGDEFEYEEADCGEAFNVFSVVVPVDKWPEELEDKSAILKLPIIGKNGLKTENFVNYELPPGATMPACNGELKLELYTSRNQDASGFKLLYELTQSGQSKPLVEEQMEVPLVDEIAPRVIFNKEEYSFSTKNTNQEYLDLYPPQPLMAIDHCSGIKSLKVSNGYSTYKMTYDEASKVWKCPSKMRFYRDERTKLTYYCWDYKNNKSKKDIWVHVKNGAPYTISSGKKSISISGEKQWIDVSKFAGTTYGGWNKYEVYGRRLDWEDFCIDLCSDDVQHIHSQYDFNRVNALSVLADGHGDHKIEHHYKKQIEWLKKDGNHCDKKIAHAWEHAIKEYWAEHCIGHDEHGYPKVWMEKKDPLGGGWCKEIPFSCDDACKEVMVEIIYMDHYCNWHKDWVTVNVNASSSSNKIANHLGKVTISCEAFGSYYEEIVQAAIDAGASTNGVAGELAFDALDEALGTYMKAHHSDYNGWPMDEYGNKLDKEFAYKDMKCYKNYKVNKTWEYDHYGNKIWVYDTVWSTTYSHVTKKANHGYINATCATRCEQDIWDLRNDCGLGKIKRRFTVYTECDNHHYHSNSRTYESVIEIVPGCNTLDHSMIKIPKDTVVCGPLDFALNGNVELGEDFPKADLEVPSGCLMIGYAVKDQVFKLIGYEHTYKVLREYKFSNWCTGDKLSLFQKIVIDELCDEYEDTPLSVEDDEYVQESVAREAGEVEGVDTKLSTLSASLTPNLVSTESIYRFDAAADEPIEIVIQNNLGQVVKRYDVMAQSGANQLLINVEDLANGAYWIVASSKKEEYSVQKMVVAK